MTIREAINVLHQLASASADDLDTVVCQVLWLREDIEYCESQNEGMVALTDDEKDDLLNCVEKRHDASLGITYDTLNWEVIHRQTPQEKAQ